MEDNNFPLDIIWLSRRGFVVHIEENLKCYVLSLELSSSSLEKDAQYVLESVAGFSRNRTPIGTDIDFSLIPPGKSSVI